MNGFKIALYLLAVFSSGACAVLLFRGYSRRRLRLLMWSAVCFVGLTINNVALFVDLVVFPRPKNFVERLAAGELFSSETRQRLRLWISGPQAPLPSIEDLRQAAEPRVEVLAPTFRLR